MTHTFPRVKKPMKQVVQQDPSGIFKRVLQTNSSSGGNIGFSHPQDAPPSGAGVHKLNDCSKVMIYPYGSGSGTEFRMAVEFWFPIYDNPAERITTSVGWVPIAAGIFDVEINGSIRCNPDTVCGPLIPADEFCDVGATAATTTSGFIHKDWDDFVAVTAGDDPTLGGTTVILNTSGASYIKFFFDKNGGTGSAATNANALFMEI